MASNQIYDRSLQYDQLNEQVRANSLNRALQEAEFRKRYELEQQQMRQAQAQQSADNQFRQQQFELQKQVALQPKEEGFSLAKELYGQVQRGNTRPEVLKGLGMYIEPQQPKAVEQITPYQQASLDIQRERLNQGNITKQIPLQREETAKKAMAEKIINSAREGLKTIEDIEKNNGINNFGLTGALPSIPGTKRVIWEANIDKFKNQQVLDLMNNLKAASRTGATGFGQLSNKELGLLQSASTVLRRDLPQEYAKEYLDNMKEVLKKVLQESGAEYSNVRDKYNQLREQGYSPEQARQQLGI